MTSGRSEEDKIINKCQMPWNLLLSGMEWQDIAVMSNQKLSEMIGLKRRDKVNDGPQQDPDDGQGQDPNDGQGNGGSNPRGPNPDHGGPGGSNPGANPNPGLDPDAGSGLDPNNGQGLDPDNGQGLDPNDLPVVQKWSDRHPRAARIKPLAFVIDKIDEFINKTPILAKLFKRNKKDKSNIKTKIVQQPVQRDTRDPLEVDMSVETDVKKIKGIVIALTNYENKLQRMIESEIKYPEIQAPLRTILDDTRKNTRLDIANLETLESTAAIFIGQGAYTTEEMMNIMKETAIREGKDPEAIEMKEPDKSYTVELREVVDKQVKYLLPRDIEAREEAWTLAGIYSDEELAKVRETAAGNQAKEDEKIEGLRVKKAQVGNKKLEAQTRLSELENGTNGAPAAPTVSSLKQQRAALVSRLQTSVNQNSNMTYRDDDEMLAAIGKVISEGLDERDKAKVGQGDDEAQL